SGLVILRVVSQGLLIGFHRFLVFLVLHEHIAHIVKGLVLFGFSVGRISRLFVAAKGFPVTLPVIVGISQVKGGRHVFIALGNGLSVIAFRGDKIVFRELIVGFPGHLGGGL